MRSASVVRPSPQHLSRGKFALSIIVTSRPDLTSSIAAAHPAGRDVAGTRRAAVRRQLARQGWLQAILLSAGR